MQLAQVQMTWKQVYQEALFELEPDLLRSKLEVANTAVEARLRQLRLTGDFHSREVLELTDARRILRYLQENEQT
jgi:hypothetical protein